MSARAERSRGNKITINRLCVDLRPSPRRSSPLSIASTLYEFGEARTTQPHTETDQYDAYMFAELFICRGHAKN